MLWVNTPHCRQCYAGNKFTQNHGSIASSASDHSQNQRLIFEMKHPLFCDSFVFLEHYYSKQWKTKRPMNEWFCKLIMLSEKVLERILVFQKEFPRRILVFQKLLLFKTSIYALSFSSYISWAFQMHGLNVYNLLLYHQQLEQI